MTERPSLFRQEALEFHTRRAQPEGVLRIAPWWTGWLYWIALASVAAGVVVAGTVHISETTSGPAMINVQERTFAVFVPDSASADLQEGQLVRLQVDGSAGPLAARVRRVEAADQAELRRAGFASSSQPGVLVTGALPSDADVASLPSAPQREGRAVVVLGSETILNLFLSAVGRDAGEGEN